MKGNGYAGKMLRVDLTKRAHIVEEIDLRTAKAFIGSRGLASKILLDEIDPKIEPLSPENKLIFATGPLTATVAPTGGRYTASCKSPLTGAIACSNSGGYFGAELKYAGFDLLIIEGRADRPVYIWIDDGDVEIRDASACWGKTTHQCEDLIKGATHQDAKMASIGHAGEKLVLFACIMNDKHRAAGRSGVGAVMGSKNLKAVAVRGTKPIAVADQKTFYAAVERAFTTLRKSPVTGQGLPAYGTNILMNIINECGMLPTKNFQTGVFPGAGKISGEKLAEKLLLRNKGCFGCSIACGRVTSVRSGQFSGSGEGPEYETAWALGADCGVDDLDAVTKAGYLCNELGMDTISAGASVATAMELYERGYLSKSDIGFELPFGDGAALVKMIEMIGLRQGFGDILAEGSFRAASKFGHPELFMGVKKQEFAAYDPRGAQAMGLGYATSNRGACHLKGYTISPEILGIPEKINPNATEGKARWQKTFQDLTAVVDSSGICLFITFGMGAEEVLGLLATATGFGYDMASMFKAGERIWNTEKLFNIKAGFTSADDTLPARLLEEGLPEGPNKGQVARLSSMLGEYYSLRGWDERGVPTAQKLLELGISA